MATSRPPFYLKLLLSFTAFLLVACGGEPEESMPKPVGSPSASGTAEASPTMRTNGGTSEPTATIVPPVAERFPEELLLEATAILSQVEDVRGLEARDEIGMNLIGRSEAVAFIRANITPKEIETARVQDSVYLLLGMIPEGTDVLEALLGLLGLGIAGFYNTDLESFCLLDDLGGLSSSASQQTIVHELVHALQDQHYDLDRLVREREDDWDATAALLSVVEGDAVAAEVGYFGSSLRGRPACFSLPPFSFSFIPCVVIRELDSRYDDGLCFVEAVRGELGEEGEMISSEPPTSTEQILHPEKYLPGEMPVAVSLPSLEAAQGLGYELIESSTLGELGLQNLLIPGLAEQPSLAQSAAAGWGGDSWAYLENVDHLLLVVLAWDSEADAQEFNAALSESLGSRADKPIEASSESGFAIELDAKVWQVRFAGERTTILVGDEADVVEQVAASIDGQ